MNDKKLIVLKDEIEEPLNNKIYFKLDANNEISVYQPLVAPKNFREYIEKNNIKEAYVIDNTNDFLKYKDLIYTIVKNTNNYKIEKGFKEEEKYFLKINYDIKLSNNVFKYIYNNGEYKLYDRSNKKINDYCYILNEYSISFYDKDKLTKVYEVVPGILTTKPLAIDSKTLIKKKKKP